MRRRFLILMGAVFLGAVSVIGARPASADTWQGQFQGEFFGAPAVAQVTLERIGDLFEVSGQVQVQGSVFYFTADGWSGAGTMFEYPSISQTFYIQLSEAQGGFALRVHPYDNGPTFYFRQI